MESDGFPSSAENCAYQNDVVENLHGWRPPSGALLTLEKTLSQNNLTDLLDRGCLSRRR